MADPEQVVELMERLDQCFRQMIDQQQQKALKIAQRFRPNVTDDDLMDPHSIPEVSRRPEYSYEDGMANGLVAAHVAFVREAREYLTHLEENSDKESDSKA